MGISWNNLSNLSKNYDCFEKYPPQTHSVWLTCLDGCNPNEEQQRQKNGVHCLDHFFQSLKASSDAWRLSTPFTSHKTPQQWSLHNFSPLPVTLGAPLRPLRRSIRHCSTAGDCCGTTLPPAQRPPALPTTVQQSLANFTQNFQTALV